MWFLLFAALAALGLAGGAGDVTMGVAYEDVTDLAGLGRGCVEGGAKGEDGVNYCRKMTPEEHQRLAAAADGMVVVVVVLMMMMMMMVDGDTLVRILYGAATCRPGDILQLSLFLIHIKCLPLKQGYFYPIPKIVPKIHSLPQYCSLL